MPRVARGTQLRSGLSNRACRRASNSEIAATVGHREADIDDSRDSIAMNEAQRELLNTGIARPQEADELTQHAP